MSHEQQVHELTSELLAAPADWSMLSLAEHVGVELVQMPFGFAERVLAPDPSRIDCTGPAWLPPHPQDARQIVEVPQEAEPARKAAALARGVVVLRARERGIAKTLSAEQTNELVRMLCERYPWSANTQHPR